MTENEKTDFINELIFKAQKCNEKTESHCNVHISVEDLNIPLRVDDRQLMFLGAALLPNILNYLVNIVPQLIYPYIVAYLQDLSDEESAITISELYDLVKTVLVVND